MKKKISNQQTSSGRPKEKPEKAVIEAKTGILTNTDLKGKKVDAFPDTEADKPVKNT